MSSDRRLTAPAVRGERARLRERLALAPREAARALLGMLLVRRLGRQTRIARIVETEAYLGERDPAAHAYRGRTPRTDPLWGAPGTWYVYFVYGMHHCLNVAVEPEGRPGCVLIRAAELDRETAATARGPGRLTRALGVDRRLSGRDAFERASGLWLREGSAPPRVGVSPRIGIRRAAQRPLRFFDAESDAVSRPPRSR